MAAEGRIRFTMIGGFLGAGKTTTIGKLAGHYQATGANVGIVTNDQAFGLVDTGNLRHAGFSVEEVPGACFCCKFDDLIATTQKLGADRVPDIILAEPVGSCTDLAATVIEPMRRLYGDHFEMGPLVVLLKPEHGRKILAGASEVGFSPKAAYIFLKQLEEADVIAINKIDKLSAAELNSLTQQIQARFPGKRVIHLSAKSGAGLGDLIASADATPSQRKTMMDVDYDVYAEGEAELGWLNCQVEVRSASPISLDNATLELVRALEAALARESAEAAHLKVMTHADGEVSIANLVASDAVSELSLASGASSKSVDMVINARVAMDPEQLEEIVRQVVNQEAERIGATFEIRGMQRFRPGRPVPTHRVTAASEAV